MCDILGQKDSKQAFNCSAVSPSEPRAGVHGFNLQLCRKCNKSFLLHAYFMRCFLIPLVN